MIRKDIKFGNETIPFLISDNIKDRSIMAIDGKRCYVFVNGEVRGINYRYYFKDNRIFVEIEKLKEK